MERVSKRKVLTRVSHNHNFCFDVRINYLLKEGSSSWHLLNIMIWISLFHIGYSSVIRGIKGVEIRRGCFLSGSDTISGMWMTSDGIEEQLVIGDVDMSV